MESPLGRVRALPCSVEVQLEPMPLSRIRPDNGAIYSGAARIFLFCSSFCNLAAPVDQILAGRGAPSPKRLQNPHTRGSRHASANCRFFDGNRLAAHHAHARPPLLGRPGAMATCATQYAPQMCPAATAFPSTSD